MTTNDKKTASTKATKDGLTLCVVCGKPILDNNECFSMGSDGYRHKKCKPGSSQWAAKYGESEISKALAGKTKGSLSTPKATPKIQDPLRQQVKEFCGRAKYMRYMDTINKMPVRWGIEAWFGGIAGKPEGVCVAHWSTDPVLDAEVLYNQLKGLKGTKP